MTQNDISYYNARKAAQDNRLRRKETKRHNKEMERLEQQSVAASQLGAEARMVGAQASAATAATNQAKYELDWEREYGWSYGTPTEHMTNLDNYRYLDNDQSSGILVPVTPTSNSSYRGITLSPQSYINAVRKEQQIVTDISATKTGQVKTIFDIAKTGSDTVRIVESVIDPGHSKYSEKRGTE